MVHAVSSLYMLVAEVFKINVDSFHVIVCYIFVSFTLGLNSQ